MQDADTDDGNYETDLAPGGKVEAICHDLKQNIATGLLLSDLEAIHESDLGITQRLEMMRQQWQEAASLVALLAGEVAPRTEHVDLGELTARCVAGFKATREVAFNIAPGQHIVVGDVVLIRRAIANLLDNASRATTPTGRVSATVRSSERSTFVEVEDDGPGFGRIEAGSGLGLEIARAATSSGGGRLRIETGSPAGTCVRLIFPAVLRVAS